MNTTIFASLLLTASAGATASPPPSASPARDAEPAPIIDIAICLDVSSSMQGLIDAARQRIWSIVSDLATAEPTPDLRLALITFGHNSYDRDRGWVRLDCELTDDLDFVSQQLFALTINGGYEYVARAVHVATTELAWREGDNPLRVILVAGNESASQDRMISVEEACSTAAEKGIQINAFYCGSSNHHDATGWANVARLADGYYAAIDHNARVVLQPTPFDAQLAALNVQFNQTFLAYGASGAEGLRRQTAQDSNAGSAPGGGPGGLAERVTAKAGPAYRNSGWDLVDAIRLGTVVLSDIDEKDLPETMRSMTADERVQFVQRLLEERSAIAARVSELAALRQADHERQRAATSSDDASTFGRQVRDALRVQAAGKGLRFPADAKTPESRTAPAKTEEAGTAEDRSQSAQGGSR